MKRSIYRNLLDWKKSDNRKPLILQGARQVGKTYILKEFGKKEYKDTAYFNFEEDPALAEFFKGKISPEKIIEKLSIYREKPILPEKTLIIFDEVQIAPEALTSLKYFQEEAGQYHIAAAGSLLGIRIGRYAPFPVGKVNFLNLYPLSFGEKYGSHVLSMATLRNFKQDGKVCNYPLYAVSLFPKVRLE